MNRHAVRDDSPLVTGDAASATSHRSRNVVVIGGTSGIGRATAAGFLRAGDRVVVVSRSKGSGQRATASIREDASARHGDCEWMQTDVADPKAVSCLFERLADHFDNRLDVAVNAAGIPGIGVSLVDYPDDMFRQVINTNLIGTFLLVKYEARMMLRNTPPGGIIFNFSSVNGVLKAAKNTGPYSASKAAVLGLTKVAANELAGSGIRVVAILPGNINTPLLQKVMDTNPVEVERRIASIPLGRLGQPEEVADVVVVLANHAGYMTGATIVIDGGVGNT